MPIKITHTLDGGVVVIVDGIVNAEELIQANSMIYKSKEEVKNLKYQIIDFRRIQDIAYEDTDIDRIAYQDKLAHDMNPDMLIAVVCDQDLIFGLSRIWEAKSLIPFTNTSVFRKLEDAYLWINEHLQPSLAVRNI